MPVVTFLGTGGSFVSQTRACAGVYVEGNLLDCGFGVLTNLRRAGIPLDMIERIFISHTHSDHIGDFTGLVWAMGLEGRRRRLEVISSKETADSLKRVMELQSTPSQILKFGIEYLDPNDVGVRSCSTIHVPDNRAYRLDLDGKSIVYTGDTVPCLEVVKLARGCELLIHDSTYLARTENLGRTTLHSSARQAAIEARDAGARAVALTHIFPGPSEHDYETEARDVRGVESFVAKDLLRITV